MSIDFLKQDMPVLADGAMGTWYQQLLRDQAAREAAGKDFPELFEHLLNRKDPSETVEAQPELANRTDPETIVAIHRAYLAAGSRLLRTNSFSINQASLGLPEADLCELIDLSIEHARTAARDCQDPVAILGSIGPVRGSEDPVRELLKIAQCFIDRQVDALHFETFGQTDVLWEVIRQLRKQKVTCKIGASFAVTPDGYTPHGVGLGQIVEELAGLGPEGPDYFGLNCQSGPSHLGRLIAKMADLPLPLAVMPNAGYPSLSRGLVRYEGSPAYFAEQMLILRDLQVQILGGCCGTTPEHMAEVAKKLAETPRGEPVFAKPKATPKPDSETRPVNHFQDAFEQGRKVIAVEYDSPLEPNLEEWLAGCRSIKAHGADAITIADSPVARARVDSSIAAIRLKREVDVEVLPHLTCRDRNLNALKAILMGLNIEGIYNPIIVTGDPVHSTQREDVKPVFHFNSVQLSNYVAQLNREIFRTPMTVSAALNVNAAQFDAELNKAKRKQTAGVTTFFTQPVMTEQAVRNLEIARSELTARIMGGLLPIISERNAEFMVNEMSGIAIDPEMIRRFAGLERDQAEELGEAIAVDYAGRIKDLIDGYYLITPFKRVRLICRIIERVKEGLS